MADVRTETAADVHRAAAALRRTGTAIGTAVAELLEHIADDMDCGAAHERLVYLRTPAEHTEVFSADGLRMDWTAALAVARLVLGKQP